MKAKGSLVIDSPNLNLSTKSPQLIFKELESFVAEKHMKHAQSNHGKKMQSNQFVK